MVVAAKPAGGMWNGEWNEYGGLLFVALAP